MSYDTLPVHGAETAKFLKVHDNKVDTRCKSTPAGERNWAGCSYSGTSPAETGPMRGACAGSDPTRKLTTGLRVYLTLLRIGFSCSPIEAGANKDKVLEAREFVRGSGVCHSPPTSLGGEIGIDPGLTGGFESVSQNRRMPSAAIKPKPSASNHPRKPAPILKKVAAQDG